MLFALLLPMLLALGAVVLGLGNWFTHARNLQTKVDAAAFAGGAMWGFPCGSDIDGRIEAEARLYFGSHTAADADPTSLSSPHNPQVGGIGGDRIYVSLNQADWWRGSFPASDFSSPTGSVCQSKILDVKATEQDVSPLWKLIPLFPDIKRKARVQIEEIDGLTGLLPIAVRLPQPLSAAAIFYDEASPTKEILDVRYFRQVCTGSEPTDCIYDAPAGLGQWTTEPEDGDTESSWASFPVSATTGVVVATSVRPGCGVGNPPAGPPCMEDEGWIGEPIDDFCRWGNGIVRCFDADGVGAGQTVQSGVHFIRGYGAEPVGSGRPELRSAWLEDVDCSATAYFNSTPASCLVKLTVVVDIGSKMENPPPDPPDDVVETRSGTNVEVRYCLARNADAGDDLLCDTQFGVAQDLECSGGSGKVTCSTVATYPQIAAASQENALAIQVRLRRTSVDGFPLCSNAPDAEYNNNCRWFYTGAGYASDSVPPTAQEILDAPVQRSFMGDIERTTPLRWLRLTVDRDCDLLTFDDRVVDGLTGFDAASHPAGQTACYVVDMGTAGGLARDQDEPPIAFNLGGNSSQRAYVDCDPNIQPDPREEIAQGCQSPPYAANKFDTSRSCPDVNGFWNVPKPAPFDTWPPFRCVLTQTGNSDQVIQGFNKRLFGRTNNPRCPNDDMTYVRGRNYWHRMNNDYKAETFAWDGTGPPSPNGTPKGNTLRSDDPRLVTLFFTTYDSFSQDNKGNEVYPIVGFGNFYVTGYGETRTRRLIMEDPCDGGNDGDLTNGTGNEPPPDLDYSTQTRWVWGHFVKDVTPAPFTTGGSGVLCNPEASFQPCVAVLVE